MDIERTRKVGEEIDNLIQEVLDSSCDNELRNLFVMTACSLKDLYEDVEHAHKRLDARKKEYQDLLEQFKKLSEQIAECNSLQVEQTKACKALVECLQTQIDSMNRSVKHQRWFIMIVSVVTLGASYGTLKGLSMASSIWSAIKLFIPM